MFKALHRLFVYLGLLAEKSTETQAIDEAMIERGIRDQRSKADSANHANGQMKTQMILLKEQIRNEERQVAEYTAQLKLAAQTNDEATGAHYAELLDKDHRRAIEKAVRGMLPKNSLARQQLSKLQVYSGPSHPHAAQKPVPFDFTQVAQ